MHLDIDSPEGDGNKPLVTFISCITDLDIDSPKGDGNDHGFILMGDISTNLDIDSPKGDGNLFPSHFIIFHIAIIWI